MTNGAPSGSAHAASAVRSGAATERPALPCGPTMPGDDTRRTGVPQRTTTVTVRATDCKVRLPAALSGHVCPFGCPGGGPAPPGGLLPLRCRDPHNSSHGLVGGTQHAAHPCWRRYARATHCRTPERHHRAALRSIATRLNVSLAGIQHRARLPGLRWKSVPRERQGIHASALRHHAHTIREHDRGP
jgi:hypothetical protein